MILNPNTQDDGSRSKDPLSHDVISLFLEFLNQLERDPSTKFEDFCARHAEECEGLREVYREWGEFEDKRKVDSSSSKRTSSPNELIFRLWSRRLMADRYERVGQIGEGAMGRILEIRDVDMRRRLAMKVIRERDKCRERKLSSPSFLRRFLDEAQVTGQLDHPGVVSVHDIGIDADGQVFFTMKLVKGFELEEVFERASQGRDGWTTHRVLEAFLRVCDAMAYAHDKGVIHRDLKPSNVMVGRFGEVFVMDWGLARILSKKDTRDLRLTEKVTESVWAESERALAAEGMDSPLVTMDGAVLGTPAYMSPEQAKGQLQKMGPSSDIYAVGAMLYRYLTGCGPYGDNHERILPFQVLLKVQAGPPTEIHDLQPKAPEELVAICKKAMARRPDHRYPTMEDLRDDLRNYIEGRVVAAHRKGPLIEARKWILRNRAVAASALLIILVLTLSGFALAWAQNQKRQEVEAERRVQSRLIHEIACERMIARAADIWPVHPSTLGAMSEWIDDTGSLLNVQPQYESSLAELAKRAIPNRAKPPTDPMASKLDHEIDKTRRDLRAFEEREQSLLDEGKALGPDHPTILALDRLHRRLGELEAKRRAYASLCFDDEDEQEEYDRLLKHVRDLRELSRLYEVIGLRMSRAYRLEEETITNYEMRWNDAIDSIACPEDSPHYSGLFIEPQLGFVPLRKNPETELWEFWHYLSGDEPIAKNDHEWSINHRTGMVFVLMPRGEYTLGTTRGKLVAGQETRTDVTEEPVHTSKLEMYLLSKYEMTQAQWWRAANSSPSRYLSGLVFSGFDIGDTHPVETISYEACEQVLGRWNLIIPTEAQFEAAARGGSDGFFWFPVDQASECINSLGSKDHFLLTAPVDSLVANPFGFFHILGNVAEWTRDWWLGGGREGWDPKSGECEIEIWHTKGYRGGSFRYDVSECRVTYRADLSPDVGEEGIGVRPCYEIQGEID